jgi:hypothetical protein
MKSLELICRPISLRSIETSNLHRTKNGSNQRKKIMSKPLKKIIVVFTILVLGMGSIAFAKPRFNAPRVKREPGWSGPSRLQGTAKASNKATPILERSYRPLHVYGNMTRRHHFRGTVIPSHRDRTEMLQSLVTKAPVEHKYVKNRYR